MHLLFQNILDAFYLLTFVNIFSTFFASHFAALVFTLCSAKARNSLIMNNQILLLAGLLSVFNLGLGVVAKSVGETGIFLLTVTETSF